MCAKLGNPTARHAEYPNGATFTIKNEAIDRFVPAAHAICPPRITKPFVPFRYMNFLHAMAVDLHPTRTVLGFLVGCVCGMGLIQAEELKLDAQLQTSSAHAAPAAEQLDDPVGEFLENREQPQPRLVADTALSTTVVTSPPQVPAPSSPSTQHTPGASAAMVGTDAVTHATAPAHASPTNKQTGTSPSGVPGATDAAAPLLPAKPSTNTDAPLGVGDQIAITVFGQSDLSAEVTVGDSGLIMVPMVGTLSVLNQTAAQLENLVARRLKDGGYLQNPGVSVQVKQLRSQLISVMGEVQRPGRYPIQGKMTVLEALATAGGLTQRADKSILVLRKSPTTASGSSSREEINIQLDTPNSQFRGWLDAPLVNDDVVYVGVQKQFYIHGEVRKPGAYPMEQGLTVMRALALSGGVSERGSKGRIKVHRLDVNKVLREIRAELAMPIEPEDVIYVDERLF